MSILIVIMVTMMMTMMVVVESYGTPEKDIAPRLFNAARLIRQLKKPRQNEGYVEQCRPSNLRREQLGHVNVFAFLDPSWHYSYRQAIMLELLKKRLEKSGFSNVLFFVVAPPSGLPEDDMESKIEINAWKEISKNILEFEYLNVKETLFSNSAKKKGIIFLQDTHELGIWESFHAVKDEVVIIDRCGKLTYQIIVPWSILYYPYVKAAILSTYRDDPCGSCDEQSLTAHESLNYVEYHLKNTNSGEEEIHKNLNIHTERTFTSLETVTTSYEELRRIEDNRNISTVTSLDTNTYENKILNITTEVLNVQTTTTKSIKENNSTKSSSFFTDKNIEITSEISAEQIQISTTVSDLVTTEVYTESQDFISSNEQLKKNNNSFLTINDTNTNLIANHENRHGESDVNLANVKGEQASNNAEYKELHSTPLRIILYAPHLHEKNGTLHKYTHLVLKTGSSDYHDHFSSKSTTSDQEPMVLKRSDSTILGDQKLIANESPGTYGEIGDYWQATDTDEFNNKNENVEFTDYDYTMTEDTVSNANNAFESENSTSRLSDANVLESDTEIENNYELNDFMQQRLIEHYNNLLRWIDYKLQ